MAPIKPTTGRSKAGRFKTFVANRIKAVHEVSNPSQWGYVNTETNLADYASRGLHPADKSKIEQWINGPNFLYDDETDWPEVTEGIKVLNEDLLEWKRSVDVFKVLAHGKYLWTPLSKAILPGNVS